MKVLAASVFCCLLISIVLAPPRQAQERSLEDILQRRVAGDNSEFFTTTDAFHASLGRAGIPGGMVRILDCKQDPLKRPLRPVGSSLAHVLDAIVATDPRYQWEVEGEVVNLLPATGEPILLRTRLNEFYLEDVSSASEALDQVLARPEVKKAMGSLRLKAGVSVVKSLSSPNPQRFSVRYRGGTLRQALNSIAHAQGRKVWEYFETHCNGRDEVVVRF